MKRIIEMARPAQKQSKKRIQKNVLAAVIVLPVISKKIMTIVAIARLMAIIMLKTNALSVAMVQVESSLKVKSLSSVKSVL
jgi:hypothetical protein